MKAYSVDDDLGVRMTRLIKEEF